MVFSFKGQNKISVGASLEFSLRRAAKEGRVAKGVYECAKLLESDPSKVMACLLAEDFSEDVTCHIHFVLLGAFCLEQNIPVIKIDEARKVSEILALDEEVEEEEKHFSCVLIEFPEEGDLASTDDDVLKFSEKWKHGVAPVVELP